MIYYVLAFFVFIIASNFIVMGELFNGILFAAICAGLIVFGLYRGKQKQAQAQAQKQTVIVNNYITQPTQQPDRTQIVTARVVRTNDDDLPEQ